MPYHPTLLRQQIFVIRGVKVMFDNDLAHLYEIETKRLNEQVKRNIDRFPLDFMFQLTKKEFDENEGLTKYGGRRKLPYAFTEQGIAMLSSVINTPQAIRVNIQIMRIFVLLRDTATTYQKLASKLEDLESKYDQQFKTIFETLTPSLEKDRRKIGLKEK